MALSFWHLNSLVSTNGSVMSLGSKISRRLQWGEFIWHPSVMSLLHGPGGTLTFMGCWKKQQLNPGGIIQYCQEKANTMAWRTWLNDPIMIKFEWSHTAFSDSVSFINFFPLLAHRLMEEYRYLNFIFKCLFRLFTVQHPRNPSSFVHLLMRLLAPIKCIIIVRSSLQKVDCIYNCFIISSALSYGFLFLPKLFHVPWILHSNASKSSHAPFLHRTIVKSTYGLFLLGVPPAICCLCCS